MSHYEAKSVYQQVYFGLSKIGEIMLKGERKRKYTINNCTINLFCFMKRTILALCGIRNNIESFKMHMPDLTDDYRVVHSEEKNMPKEEKYDT